MALTRHRLAYCAQRNVGIDGVLENEKIYQRIGYISYYQNNAISFYAQHNEHKNHHVAAICNKDHPAIFEYDRHCFPAARDKFLQAWIDQENGKALLYKKDGKVQGYAVRRRTKAGHKIGPSLQITNR